MKRRSFLEAAAGAVAALAALAIPAPKAETTAKPHYGYADLDKVSLDEYLGYLRGPH